ncbi:MAG: GtrA family protein [Patescibacteria group bacterium]|jgi:putative flippase GtrA
MKKSSKQSLFSELVKYGLVGVVSTVIDLVLLKLLREVGVVLWLAVAAGFSAGTVNGYFMNSRWTFRYNTEGQEAKKFSQFAVISFIGLGLTEIIVHYLSLYLNANFGYSVSQGETISKLVSVIVVFFWNFGANKIWTFNR